MFTKGALLLSALTLGYEKLGVYKDEDGNNIQQVVVVDPNAAGGGSAAQPVTGTLGALNAVQQLDVSGMGSVAIVFSGTYTATVAFDVSVDGTTWLPVRALRLSTGTAYSALALTNAIEGWVCDVAGFKFFRVRLSAYTSGSCSVSLIGSTQAANYNSSDASAIYTYLATRTSGGTLPHKLVSAPGVNATVIKNTAGQLYKIHWANRHTAWRYLKVYQKTTAPAPATDTPLLIFGLPPEKADTIDFGDIGQAVGTGISIAITGLPALNDATAIGADEVLLNTQYA